MPQSLVAVVAMALASLVAFQQHRSVLEQRMNAVRSALSVGATAVASDKLEEVGAKAFDEATRLGTIDNVADLTDFVSGAGQLAESAAFDDIDDFDGIVTSEIRTVKGKDLVFTARTEVSYVSDVDGQSEVGYPTKLKKVTVFVVPAEITVPDTIRVSEIIACGERCRW